MEKKIKHLEFILQVINRLSTNSFFIKGTSISIVSILVAIDNKENILSTLVLCLISTFIFWSLDAYILFKERLFRLLYSKVADLREDSIDFKMKIKSSRPFIDFMKSFFSISLWMYYFTISLLLFIVYFVK